MRVGLIGLGRAGAVHLEACAAVPGIEVGAVYDPVPTGRRAARTAGITAYAELASMLATEQLEAVIICAPPADHVPLAAACLRHGLHVLCEKPLALSSNDALQLFDIARRHNRVLLVASKFRHVHEVLNARELIRSGELGDPVSFEVSFCSAVDMTGRWNAQPARSGGGVIIDNGCHAFDIIYFLFDTVSRVHATQLKPVQRLAVEDAAGVRVCAGDDVVGNVRLSWSWTTGQDTYLTVRGTRGALEIGWHGSRLNRNGREWHGVGQPYNKVDAHRRMHACFLQAITQTGQPWITADDCVSVVAAVEAAYRSMDTGRWEHVVINSNLLAHDEQPRDALRSMLGVLG